MKYTKKIFMILIATSLFSCKTSKEIEKTEEPAIVEQQIEQQIEEKTEIIEEPEQQIEAEIVVEEEIPEIKIIEGIIEKVEEEETPITVEEKKILKKIDMTKWLYHKEDKVYFQLNIPYCTNPKEEYYNNLSIYVPEKLFDATENKDGTFTAKTRKGGSIYVFHLEIQNDDMKPDSVYCQKSQFRTNIGQIFVHAGGKSVIDFKAALRFLRYNSDRLPIGTNDPFIYGDGKIGGDIATIIGLSGDSSKYKESLTQIGSAETSDKVTGVFATNSKFQFEMNIPLSQSEFKLKSNSKNTSPIQKQLTYSLNRFLQMTQFPFQSKIRATALSEPKTPTVFQAEEGLLEGKRVHRPRRKIPDISEQKEYELQKKKRDNELFNGIFDTKLDYINALNSLSDKNWIEYDEIMKTAEIVDLTGFEKLLSHIKIKDEKNKNEKLTIESFFEEYPEGKKAKYWIIKNNAFRKLEESSQEADFIEFLLDENKEAFLDLVWEQGRCDSQFSTD